MTNKTKTEIKAFFQTSDTPSEAQFIDLIDSYVDKSGPLGVLETAVSGGSAGFVYASAADADIIDATTALSRLGATVVTTAAVSAVAMGIVATTAQANAGTATGVLMDPVLVKNAIVAQAITSAGFSTTAQAGAGTSDGTFISPLLLKNAVPSYAFTSANYSTTAQANAGTDATTVMNPVLVKNAIAALGNVTAATQAEQEAASSTTVYTSPGRQHFHPSAAKCWGYVTGGATPVLQASFNTTSITDSGVGALTVTIATDFSSANFATTYGPSKDTANAFISAHTSTTTPQAAGSVLIETGRTSTLIDAETNSWAFYGDQA